MDRDKLAAQLVIDEGQKFTVYLDTHRNPTVGVGHLVRREDHLAVGQAITEAQCAAFLQEDIATAIAACGRIWPDFDALPEEMQQVCANLAFNVGEHGLKTFKRFCAAVADRRWPLAAAELQNSLWYHQVGRRADRLIARVQALATAPTESV